MYDFTNFGQRLRDLRKGKNLTQEDLAHRVGVTGQAVSKWENNQSYPDITLIPDLANILGATVSYLFGEKPKSAGSAVSFPTSYQNLSLVHSANQVACYSNKTVASTDASGVKFADGSTAELTTRIVVNKGQGDILFLSREDIQPNYMDEGIDTSVTSKDFEFGHTHHLHVNTLFCSCKIVLSPDNKTRVHAKGSPKFLHILEVSHDEQGQLLEIGYARSGNNGNNFNNNERDNHLLVELPINGKGGNLQAHLDGSGDITSEIPLFESGSLAINGSGTMWVQAFDVGCGATINGSGNMHGKDAPEFSMTINGSGDAAWGHTDKARVAINGSGDISLSSANQLNATITGSGDVTLGELIGGDFTAKITGSGDITVGGACQKFDVDIVGSGDIHARELTANKAHIVLHHSGSVVLGRVVDSSVEQVKEKGSISILQRGQ